MAEQSGKSKHPEAIPTSTIRGEARRGYVASPRKPRLVRSVPQSPKRESRHRPSFGSQDEGVWAVYSLGMDREPS